MQEQEKKTTRTRKTTEKTTEQSGALKVTNEQLGTFKTETEQAGTYETKNELLGTLENEKEYNTDEWRHGNIGVMTPGDMIRNELGIYPELNLIHRIVEDFVTEFCIMVY